MTGRRDPFYDGNGRREGRGRVDQGWDQPGPRHARQQFGGHGRQFYRPASCWDPPQRYQLHGHGDRQQVTMKPPRFDGEDATNWVSRVQYYFDHLMMPDAQCLHYAVMLFDPPASEWVFNYCANTEFVTWQDFLENVRHRFDRQSFKDYFGLLAKQTQTGTVLAYHDTFERYLNRVQGIPESKLYTLFIAGLKPDLQERLRLHRPSSLTEAMALALELADSQLDQAQNTQQPAGARRPWQNRDNRLPTISSTGQNSGHSLSGVNKPQGTAGKEREQHRQQPLIRVSQAEKAERSRLGLCYWCPEKWIVGHVCKQRLLCYADDPDYRDDEELEGGQVVGEESGEIAHVHAMYGGKRSRPLHVPGTIQGREVSVLIDTGSDRDFLHPTIAESLHLPLSPIRPFRVLVGNGAALLCTHVARNTQLEMQGSIFPVDLHILPVHGPDVILGMVWLESLGKVAADFAGKTLEFKHEGSMITLKGLLPAPRQISLQTLLSGSPAPDSLDIFEVLLLQPEEGATDAAAREEFPDGLPHAVTKVLDKFRTIFSILVGMPPKRPFDHKVHLLLGTRPVNVRPYRYPYFQKNEIERQVREMLEQGIIQRSSSSFSFPVLLIRKKDGTFRFCIDYRALNTATVPDHFPIPTADELFDELGKARVFTKLDLRSGYHQIRMHEEDIFKTAFRTHDGHFEFLVMPFGLTNAPSMLRKFVIVFFDDILVYIPTPESHGQHLAEVLQVLQEHSFYVKLPKCSFCSSTVEYLGHLIGDGLLKASVEN